ncbi:MAG: HAMP domain-containing histidine kinase [Planctomycetaceae bacterium]|nr:HAMP domain-containing histidine kinase [Planctomycetaceae bacterium]
MATYFRKRSTIGLPVTLSVSIMALNVVMMICWIVLLTRLSGWTALTIGVVAFTLILIGASLWLVLTIKEIRLNHRQANFVDSVTHELKSPIATLQLYLETLRMRNQDLNETQRAEFHDVMEQELHRLDRLISQLLEVGRLDAIGEQEEPEDIHIPALLRQCAESACLHHKVLIDEVFTFDVAPLKLNGRRIVLDLIFSNLIDNAVKYGGEPPRVDVSARGLSGNRLRVSIRNNGQGIPYDDRRKVFRIFYRGGNELERRQKGTGLGLYIVQTLVRRMKGKVALRDRLDEESGCIFDIELPGPVEDLSTPDNSSPDFTAPNPAAAEQTITAG